MDQEFYANWKDTGQEQLDGSTQAIEDNNILSPNQRKVEREP
jgi:hypothetical protein